MDMIGRIRRLHSRGKKSEREIARMTGLSRNTVAKWLHGEVDSPPKYRRQAQPNKLTPFVEAIKQALKADARRPRHERRTAKALYAQIKAEGYDGGYTRLTDFIREWRQGEGQGAAMNAFVPLSFELGETRYDWQHYIPLLLRKPGALRNGAPFADMPEPLQRLRQGLLRRPGGDRVMAQVLAIVPQAGLDAVLVAVELALETGPPGKVSVEHVVNVLGRLNALPAPQTAATSLQVATPPLANTARYDSLRAGARIAVEVGHDA